MLTRLFRSSKRPFKSLTEQEVLAVAIAAEEDDSASTSPMPTP